MQLGCFLAPQLGKFITKRGERTFHSRRTGAGTRPSQRRHLQSCNGAGKLALLCVDPCQGMLEKREKTHGRRPAECCLCSEAGETTGGSHCERIAAGIIGRDFPSTKC